MILELARKLTSKLYPEIDSEQVDLYAYGFFVLFSKGLSFAEVLLSGIILCNVWNAMLFYFVFTPLREYSGGIHAMKMAKTMSKDEIMVINISGRGDKDCAAIARYRGEDLYE